MGIFVFVSIIICVILFIKVTPFVKALIKFNGSDFLVVDNKTPKNNLSTFSNVNTTSFKADSNVLKTKDFITEIVVKRLATNDLEIIWTTKADSVTVCKGLHPDNINYNNPIASVTASDRVIITDCNPAKRFYFGLLFAGGTLDGQIKVVAERFLPLTGANNFRDIGGYSTINGHNVKWGLVYRSDKLSKLSDDDLIYLSDMGLKLICDLRDFTEQKDAPNRIPKLANIKQMPIDSQRLFYVMMLMALLKPASLHNLMAKVYVDMLLSHAKQFGAVLKCLADSANLPTVFHCTGGKDRAGLTTALLLTLLDVPQETIMLDYLLTELTFKELEKYFAKSKYGKLMARLGIDPKDFIILLGVDIKWLENGLTYVANKYGSVEAYLIKIGGLTKEDIEQIRTNLLV